MCHHPVEIIEDVARGNPEGEKSCLSQFPIANCIARRIFAHRMGLTVYFDSEPTRQASEVDDITIARKLAAKAQRIGPLAKLLPEDNFGQC